MYTQISKKVREYLEIKGNTILVKTPIPYKVIRQMENETIEDAEHKEYQLNQACRFLYECMRLLNISKKKAAKEEFTLNIATGEKIIDIAARKNISHEMFMTIRHYNW